VRSSNVRCLHWRVFRSLNKLREQLHVLPVDHFELTQLAGVLPVVRKIVVTIVGRLPLHRDCRRIHAVERSAIKREESVSNARAGHVVHQTNLVHIRLRIRRIHGDGVVNDRLRLLFHSEALTNRCSRSRTPVIY